MERRYDRRVCQELRRGIGRIKICRHCNNDYCDALTIDNGCRALRVLVKRLSTFTTRVNDNKVSLPALYELKKSEMGIVMDQGETMRARRALSTSLYKCRACGLGNLQESELENHRMLHMKENPFACTICGKSYVTEAAANFHRICLHSTDHYTSMKEFNKDVGEALLSNRREPETVERATKKYNGTEEMFEEDYNLKSLIINSLVNQSNEKQDASFEDEAYSVIPYRTIMVLVMPDLPGNMRRKYIVTSRMLLHEIVATNKPPYHCPLCRTREACFNEKYLYQHMCSYHMKFRCNVCAMGFGKRDNYTSHMKKHKSNKSFKCCICDRRFTKQNLFSNHLQFHAKDQLNSVTIPYKQPIPTYQDDSCSDLNEKKLATSMEHEIGTLKEENIEVKEETDQSYYYI